MGEDVPLPFWTSVLRKHLISKRSGKSRGGHDEFLGFHDSDIFSKIPEWKVKKNKSSESLGEEANGTTSRKEYRSNIEYAMRHTCFAHPAL